MFKHVPFLLGMILLIGEPHCHEAHGSNDPSTANRVDCLAAMNSARQLAGLVNFKAETEAGKMLPIGSDNSPNTAYINAVCSGLLTAANPDQGTGADKREGTYASTTALDDSANCEKVVNLWKSSVYEFNGLPPAYTPENKRPYELAQNRSFVVLYNPKKNPTIDCAHFVCQRGTPQSIGVQPLKALVCLTNPAALVAGKRPFTASQWREITGDDMIRGPLSAETVGTILFLTVVFSIAFL